MALASVMLPLLHAHAWDWQWTDNWNEAEAWCDECNTTYTIYAESSDEAESAAEDLFCSDCGACSEDVNPDCYREHHCQFCGDCIENGEYHDGALSKYDEYLHYDCFIAICESGEVDDVCSYCHEIFGEGVVECDCEYSMITPHCTDCAEEQCSKCGICLVIDGEETDAVTGDACVEHGVCNACMEDAAAEDFIHCRQCFSCDEDVCDECGLCESCAIYEEHCPECGYCFGDEVQWCAEDGEHCIHCCDENDWKCQSCGRCMEGSGLDQCSDCELCEECCIAFSEAEGCEHGYCIASADYEDHLCPECGECPKDEECEYCGLCADCQADYHCEHELCPDGSDWDDHACPDCGECFDDGDLCEYCGLCENCREHCDHDFCPENDDDSDHFICDQCGDCYEGVDRCDQCQLCLDCCADNTSSLGCDHDFCIESDDFAEHWCYEDDQCLELCEHEEDCEHENVTTAWKINSSAHWLVCEDCGITVNKALHTEGDPVTLTSPNAATHTNGTAQVNCAVCNYKMGIVSIPYVEAPADGSPYIITQPTDYTGKTSTCAYLDVPQRYATFKVRAGGKDLTYQWYKMTSSGLSAVTDDTPDEHGFYQHAGAQTATLKAFVSTDDCDEWVQQHNKYYCVISNEHGSVTSDIVTKKAQHVFGRYRSKDSETHENWCFGECSEMKEVSKHRFTEWTLARPATSDETGLREQQCMDCGYKNTEVIPKVEPNHVHSFDMAKYSITQHWFVCKCGIASPDAAVNHVFDQTEVVTPATETAKGQNKIICSACGYFKTEKTDKLPHVHDWYSWDEIGMYLPNHHWGPDPTKGTRGPESHTIRCKGCNEKKTDSHVWPVWENSRDAKIQGTDTIPGKQVRYCDVCAYEETAYYPYGSWPIMVIGGKAYDITIINGRIVRSKQVAYATKGKTIFLAYDPKAAMAELSWNNIPVKFKGWVSGTDPGGNTDIPWDGGRSDIILQSFPIRFNRTAGLYAFTMPDGPAVIYAETEACDHSGGTKQTARVEPTCSTSGHEPHTLCKDCNTVLEEGARIPALGHDLPDTPIAGTEQVEYCAIYYVNSSNWRLNDATHGFTGDFVCNRCGETVKGKRTPLKHGAYNTVTHKANTSWYGHTEGYVAETCLTDGRSGNDYCKFCNKIVERSTKIPRRGHDWEAWHVVREATTKVKGMERRVCANDETHVETRLTDYSGPYYALKLKGTKPRIEFVYGEPFPAVPITFRSVGRDSVYAITLAEESETGGVYDFTYDGMTITTIQPSRLYSYMSLCMELMEIPEHEITLCRGITDEGDVYIDDDEQGTRFIVANNVKKTSEKYTLNVLNGFALQNANRKPTLQLRGGEEFRLEVEDEWKKDFLRWEFVEDASGLMAEEMAHEDGRFEREWGHSQRMLMSPNNVTVRAIYKQNAPAMSFSETEVTATMDALNVTPKLRTSPGNLPVTYSSSDESVATVDAKTGAITTYLKAGIATITATFSGNAHYAPASASYSLRITQDFIDGVASPKSSPEGTDLIYNLAGQRIGKKYKGISVKKSKKVLTK